MQVQPAGTFIISEPPQNENHLAALLPLFFFFDSGARIKFPRPMTRSMAEGLQILRGFPPVTTEVGAFTPGSIDRSPPQALARRCPGVAVCRTKALETLQSLWRSNKTSRHMS